LPEIIIRNKALIERTLIVLAFVACFVGCWKKQVSRRPAIFKAAEPVQSKQVRVLLHDDVAELSVSSSGGFSIRDNLMLLKGHFSKESEAVNVTVELGVFSIGDRKFGNGSMIVPDEFSIISVNGKAYRGDIKLLTKSGGKSF
jgi:hypothetical protein